jgi:hypothetical protein
MLELLGWGWVLQGWQGGWHGRQYALPGVRFRFPDGRYACPGDHLQTWWTHDGLKLPTPQRELRCVKLRECSLREVFTLVRLGVSPCQSAMDSNCARPLRRSSLTV